MFPDARVIVTHRDPLRAQGSVTNVLGTFYWMRSDQPFDAQAFEELLTPEGTAARLDSMIDWIESGRVPSAQISHSRYADLMRSPVAALDRLYDTIGMEWGGEARAAVERYLSQKPQHKFGAHRYEVDRDDRVRRLFARYQSYFDVPSEA